MERLSADQALLFPALVSHVVSPALTAVERSVNEAGDCNQLRSA